MENQYFDKQLRAIMNILRQDYAGLALTPEPVDFQYYMQAAGMAWKEGKLDQLLFLRYVNQMLATTMDRSLKLRIDSPTYIPWHVGFDARRFGDALYVTAAREDARLQAGDKIVSLNRRSPVQHLEKFQKNFLYATEPERELWHNVLKMTDHILVEHRDGRCEDLPLEHISGSRPGEQTFIREIAAGIMHVRVGAADADTVLLPLIWQNEKELDGALLVIIDLRAMSNVDETVFLPLVPYVLKEPKTMNEAVGERTYRTLYTKDNCARRIEQMQSFSGMEGIQPLIQELYDHAGCGWLEEHFTLWDDVPEEISPRGKKTILLTDTYTEGAAESFALLAKQEGRSLLVGRATMGNLDYASFITVKISDTAFFTYPMSITKEAAEGNGYLGRGVQPDEILPFTPEECLRDVLLERACREV